MGTDNFIAYTKTDYIYRDIAEYFEARFDTTNYQLNRPLPKGKNKKVVDVMKDELGGKIMKEFLGLRAETYSYLIDDGNEDKKGKGTKKCVLKTKLKFQDCKNCLEATQLKNKINRLEKNKINVDSLKKRL